LYKKKLRAALLSQNRDRRCGYVYSRFVDAANSDTLPWRIDAA